MSLTWGNSLPLERAALCMNCEQISDARSEYCPSCAAFANWLPIERVLEARKKSEQMKGAAA